MKRNKKRTLAMLFCLVLLCAMLPMQTFAKSITLNQKKGTYKVGEKFTLTAVLDGINGTVKWTSSNTKIASVNQKGVVTVKKPGTVTIKAKAGGKTAKYQLTAKKVSWKEAYKAFLQKETVKAGNQIIAPDYFYVINLNKSGAPELVIASSELTSRVRDFYVYTYKDGKVNYAGTCYSQEGNLDLDFTYAPKCKGIYTGRYTTVNGKYGIENCVYTVKDHKLVKGHHAKASYDGKVYITGTTNKQNKKVTLSAFNNFKKQYFKNLKYCVMYANTEANRTSYIK